jgi:hypothetical protein
MRHSGCAIMAALLLSCRTPGPPDIPRVPNPSREEEGVTEPAAGLPVLSVDLPVYNLPEEPAADAAAETGVPLVTRRNEALEVRPKPEHYQGGAVVYPWLPNQVYQLFTAVEQLTNIRLEPGEELVAPPASGNTDAFEVRFTYSVEGGKQRAQVYVMPFAVGKRTTLFVNTSRRTYSFMVYSYQSTFMPLVSFTYPLDMQAAVAARIAQRDTDILLRAASPISISITPSFPIPPTSRAGCPPWYSTTGSGPTSISLRPAARPGRRYCLKSTKRRNGLSSTTGSRGPTILSTASSAGPN